MRGIVAVARREILERRMVFLAAGLLGILPFLAPLLPAVRRYGAPEVRFFCAAFFAVVFAGSLSLVLGGSTIGRDLSERRLGFYFARPLSGGAIWAGKFLGIWLIVVLGAVLILLPVSLLDFSSWSERARVAPGAGEIALLFAGAVIVCLGLGNLVSLAFRARSVLLAGDLVFLALFASAIWWIVTSLLMADAPRLLERISIGIAAAAAIALLASGLAQVSIGRTDAARGNRARFAVLWLLLFAAAGLSAGYVRWLLSPSPGDLLSASVQAAPPRGTWIEVEGWARNRTDYPASLFYDVASGRYARARLGREGAVAFSDDGTAAAWTERASLDRQAPQDVWICRFGTDAVKRVRTPISARAWNIAMSPDGSRVAIQEEKTVAIYDVPSGRLVGSAALDTEKHYLRAVFRGNDRLRIYRLGPTGAVKASEPPTPASIEVLDLDLARRKLVETASIRDIRRPFRIAFNDRDERLIVWEKGNAVSLYDASTGRRLAPLAAGGWDTGSRAFLSDGRPILTESAGGTGRVHLFTREGLEERVFDVGPAGLVRLGAEPAAGQITLAIGPSPEVWGASDSYLLDLKTGSLRRLGWHLAPIASSMRWRLPQPEPGSEVTRLFSRSDGSLVRLDPGTGSLKTLFGGRPPEKLPP